MGHKKGFYEEYIKRPLDFCIALAALIVLFPVLLITALLVRIKLGSPVIFRQKRPGLNEKIFTMYKFRTMSNEKDEKGELLPDKERLTKFGMMLRRSSLDELPEIFNILKGDLALCGPRPLLIRYLPFYREHERSRHSVRPGLTGLAQINGRNNVDWDERLQYDVEYIKNITFLGDIKILFRTIIKVLKRSDIASGEQLIIQDLDVERDTQAGIK